MATDDPTAERALSRLPSGLTEAFQEQAGGATVQGVYGGSALQLNRSVHPSLPIPSDQGNWNPHDSDNEGDGEIDIEQRQALLHSLSTASSTRRSVAGITPVTPDLPHTPDFSVGPRSHLGSESGTSDAIVMPLGVVKRALDPRSLLFGCINAAITVPVMIAFCKVIFQEPEFQPYQSKLVRLVFLSAATHQLVFTCRSCVPGAVGQVQDVGLIFLSSISTAVVLRGRESHAGFEDTLASVLLLLTLTTTLVGIMVVVVARCKLANLVQYVPVPVVGGYLAYVGFFICVSGLELATGISLKTPQQFLGLFSAASLARLAPAVAAWQVFSNTVRHFTKPIALPVALVAVVAVFYLVLYSTGHRIEDAQQAGWLPAPDEPMPRFWEVWKLFRVQDWPANIDWGVIPSQLPNIFALFIVVAFGSCMDIAAIQAQCSDELDFNNELELIGISNAVVGVAGVGYTGSYIFSQTLFNMRFGASGVITGIPIIISELALMMLPSSPVQYIPQFFFGGLMVWLGVDIMVDWLVTSWGKLRKIEYCLIWITFFSVTIWGLETGIVVGIISAMAVFAFEYSQLSVTCFNVSASRSSYMRTYHHRWILDQLSSNMVAVSLSGYIFFGSVTTLSEKAMLIADLLIKSGTYTSEGEDAASIAHQAQINKVKMHAPKTLLLDFRKVTGFDATAAQTFNVLRQRLEKLGVEMVITHIPQSRMYIHHLLVAYGVAAPGDICTAATAPPPSPAGCLVFDGLNTGLHFCEERLLEVAVERGVCEAMVDDLPLHAHLQANWSESWQEQSLLPAEISSDFEAMAASISQYLEVVEYNEYGSTIFARGDRSGEVYLVQTGIVSCEVRTLLGVPMHSHHVFIASYRFG
mmetsp:Transcript_6977/g.19685  ORF Transcript_6977/g.19685 Transcript_6977/m.19685 type:complete len:866 (+) Transcript_6977:118-2715(+)